MSSVNDLKLRLESLEPHELCSLEKWLDERGGWKKGALADCFVIMPFSMTEEARSQDYWTTFFEDFLTKSLAACGLRARKSEPTPANIVEGIMEDLAWTNRVVAVLTDFNANVWYELGVRHSIRRGATVMICQEDQIAKLPFDLKQHGVVGYKASLDRELFIKELTAQLVKTDEKLADSPVSGFVHMGVTYCVHRALAGRREVMKKIRQFGTEDGDAGACAEVGKFNKQWLTQGMQVTVIKNDKLLLHQGGVEIGTDANILFEDAVSANTSQYQAMKARGEGLWLGSVKGHVGRLTAFAYETLQERGWLIAIEAHVKQAEL